MANGTENSDDNKLALSKIDSVPGDPLVRKKRACAGDGGDKEGGDNGGGDGESDCEDDESGGDDGSEDGNGFKIDFSSMLKSTKHAMQNAVHVSLQALKVTGAQNPGISGFRHL
ncbi:hypothetical protein Ddc_09371 [Ditylenchus destructor]|nr:hypothetical protein Ddc_09371 [Ditylenchus destructor]